MRLIWKLNYKTSAWRGFTTSYASVSTKTRFGEFGHRKIEFYRKQSGNWIIFAVKLTSAASEVQLFRFGCHLLYDWQLQFFNPLSCDQIEVCLKNRKYGEETRGEYCHGKVKHSFEVKDFSRQTEIRLWMVSVYVLSRYFRSWTDIWCLTFLAINRQYSSIIMKTTRESFHNS